MYQPVYTRQFKKDMKRIEKSGSRDIEKLKAVSNILTAGGQLSLSYRDHKLKGDYTGHRECHIEPDWLLLYRINQNEETIIFVRTGSHADIFE